MQPASPLLTIAIPTYNRCQYLSELLECLLPQTPLEPRLELLISDNCSTDNTQATVEEFRKRGLNPRYLRNEVNIGADANFLQCFREATGKYFWMIGDDDVLVEGAVGRILKILERRPNSDEESGDFDLAFVSAFSFSGKDHTARALTKRDPLGRFAEVITDGQYFLDRAHALIALISLVIVNRERLTAAGKPPIRDLGNCNLQQLAWVLPSVRRNARILYIWERLVGYRVFNSGGWGPCEIFGVNFPMIASQYYADEPELAATLRNGLVRLWLPAAVMQVRQSKHKLLITEDFVRTLSPVHSRNWRYWVFLYPVASLPLELANAAFWFISMVNKALRALQVLANHIIRRGETVPAA